MTNDECRMMNRGFRVQASGFRTLRLGALACVLLLLPGCGNMTPEQQAQWSATANAAAQQASGILLDEGAARLKESRKKKGVTQRREDAKDY